MAKNPNKYKILRSGSGIPRVVAIIFSIVELILVFRFILKLLGANTGNGVVQGLYDISQPLIGFFEGIFATTNTNILGILGVFEPATIIAVVAFSVLEWVLLKLISGKSGRRFGRKY